MKEKLNQEVARIGVKTLDFASLRHYEIASMLLVLFLAFIAGTTYAVFLF